MTNEERAPRICAICKRPIVPGTAYRAELHGDEHNSLYTCIAILREECSTIRAEAMAEQREKDARVCETRYAHWPNIDAALRDVSMSCGAAIRNQD